MALTLGSTGGFRTVTGVYQGQGDNAINIGSQAWTFGGNDKPLVIGASTPFDSSVNIKAFFDPSLSPLAKGGQWTQIGFIQTGEFRIQGVPTTVRIHDNSTPYPVYNKVNKYSRMPLFMKWVNAPGNYNNPPQKTPFPDFPLWELTNQPKLDMHKLFKFPQQFGGYTVYGPDGVPGGRKAGDNLCAYLNLDLDLSLMDLPFDSEGRTYFDTIDFEDLEAQVNIPSEIQFKAGYLMNYLACSGIVPLGSQIQRKQNLRGQTYFLLGYRNEFKRKSNTLKTITYAIIWQDESGTHFTFLDEDLLEEWREDEKANGRPNLKELNNILFKNYKYSIDGMNLENFRISYRFYTYACAITLDTETNTYGLELFEGFGMEVTRQYYYIISGNEGWMPSTVHTFELDNRMTKDFLKTIEVFFEKQNSEFDLVLPLIF
ncbi:hypothetical protein [Negadavirga shengliensis]|uniref:Uncharacterized protein n=1 Tax=Negadavirga shengliensis TaxID=1389218 RepID=A0ABV9T0D8_9BACT